MVDFNKLNTANTIDTILNPRDLFSALPYKDARYQYPRDVQAQVWSSWFKKRNDKDIVLKMNTGSGKTVVGLLILKSSLNENKVPAIYVVPDNYLVNQVLNEAKCLGIPVTDNHKSINFIRGKEILVCNMHKLVNGRSVFGINERKIDIGTIIIDDAHACIDTIDQQFTIKIDSNNSMYAELLRLFLPSIKEQSNSKAYELENEEPDVTTLVPFWSWKQHLDSVREILFSNSEDETLEWKLPLIREKLKYCRCVISSNEVEITPHMIPIDVITSLETTMRKIFMTATLADDSILATHFDLDENAISNVITPDIAGDVGDRLMLIPQTINEKITDLDLKEYFHSLSKQKNVVVIVPSHYRKNFWQDIADLVVENDSMYESIERMKTTHVGLVILINRYDGVDLPHDACRALVIDGLPDSRRAIDLIIESQLQGSSKAINQKLQKIEQGMGRGIRSNDDHCLIFLMGKNLISNLYKNTAIERFSDATKAQFMLSEKLSEQLIGNDLSEINKTVQLFFSRDEGWVTASKSCLASLTYSQSSSDKFAVSQRLAFNEACIGQYERAISILDNSIDESDQYTSGYSKQILAEYINYIDEVKAQQLLISAIRENKYILKPKEGISYERIKHVDEQASELQNYLSTNYSEKLNKYYIDLDATLEQLTFLPHTSNRFEEAVRQLSYFLGFTGQRPEKSYGKGPDNLWSVGSNKYFVIECKNGVTNTTINKHDMNQLNGSIAWFLEKYDHTSRCVPIMIHLGDTCEHGATPLEGCLVITKEKLELFKKNIKDFSLAMKDKINQLNEIKHLLIHHKLRELDIIQHYTKKINIKI